LCHNQTMIEIVQKEKPILRQVAQEVPVQDIGNAKIKKIIKKMQQALEEQDDGVAIAAPQVGEALRIFVVSKKVFEMMKGDGRKDGEKFDDMVFVNPKLLKLSREKTEADEGCLSVRYLYGKVLRSKKATVQALDEKGEKILVGGSGLVAQIFQHEMDHLDGVLFIDKAKDLEEIPPQKTA
jgi:peptide deformylase